MTKEEAQQFISEVLQGLWPRWKPNEEEIRGWKYRLAPYDFEKSRQSVNNCFFASDTRGIDPPTGKILKALRRGKQIDQQKNCVLLYTLVREAFYKKGRNRGMNFYGSQGTDLGAVEVDAENMREDCNIMYGCNHIIIRHWEIKK